MLKKTLVVLCLVAFALPAFAYIDPGAGSMIFQLIVGGIAGIFLALKLFGHRILTFLRLRKKE